MISRRKIISRSTDDLDSDKLLYSDEDVWHSEEKLLKDHIQEILHKWDRIDDEIWAKIVCMQKNRRFAKAYARAPILTIDGSYVGFDGFRIGLNGFNNYLTDQKIPEIKNQIGSGAKIKIDDDGNILIKRIGKENVFVKVWQSIGQKNNCIADELLKNDGQLVIDRTVKLFDMEKFLENITNELKNSYPDRKHLESQCISCVAFVKDCRNILELPIWIMIVNIVALDMLKTKLLTPVLKTTNFSDLPINSIDCFEFHRKQNHYHNNVDHHKCSANRLTLRRWKSLYPNVFGPLLPPRDYARDEKIRKLKEELEEVRIKIGNIEDIYGFNKSKDNSRVSQTNAQKSISNEVTEVKPKRNSLKQVYMQYDSGLESDPYTSDTTNNSYGINHNKYLQKNEVYGTLWE